MKFEFGAKLVKKRKSSGRKWLSAFVAGALFVVSMIQYLSGGFVPVDWFIDQMGLFPYAQYVYLGWFGLLAFFMLPAIASRFRKKKWHHGTVFFDEKTIYLKDGKERYEIPQEDLDELIFELKDVSELEQKGKKKAKGNYMTIPMSDKDYKYELEIENDEQQQQLLNMIEFLKIQHDVKVKVNDPAKK